MLKILQCILVILLVSSLNHDHNHVWMYLILGTSTLTRVITMSMQSANSGRLIFNAYFQIGKNYFIRFIVSREGNAVWRRTLVYCLQFKVSWEPDIFFQSDPVQPARRGTATGRVQGTDLQSMVHGMNGIVYLYFSWQKNAFFRYRFPMD